MEVKNVFLNGFINEEVYIEQPPSFENQRHENFVSNLLNPYMV